MITIGDISNIIYSDLKFLNIRRIANGNKVHEEVKNEFVIIHTKPEIDGERWRSSVVEVNFFVPDLPPKKEANTIRFSEIERSFRERVRGYITGTLDQSRYRYKIESVGLEHDAALDNFYLNIKLIFQTLNVI